MSISSMLHSLLGGIAGGGREGASVGLGDITPDHYCLFGKGAILYENNERAQ